MGYTKIFAIRQRLDKTVAYATNEEKTRLDKLVDYAADPKKTKMRLYESCINCKNVDNAYEAMVSTKRKWGKEDGVQGYHIIQSFKPGEVTPEQAHAIGMEFAQKLFGDRYEVVVATHLNKHHHLCDGEKLQDPGWAGGGYSQSRGRRADQSNYRAPGVPGPHQGG